MKSYLTTKQYPLIQRELDSVSELSLHEQYNSLVISHMKYISFVPLLIKYFQVRYPNLFSFSRHWYRFIVLTKSFFSRFSFCENQCPKISPTKDCYLFQSHLPSAMDDLNMKLDCLQLNGRMTSSPLRPIRTENKTGVVPPVSNITKAPKKTRYVLGLVCYNMHVSGMSK